MLRLCLRTKNIIVQILDIEKSSNGEQLKRHKAKGSFEASENVKKSKNENGTFTCLTCLKVFSKQSNASRHSKSCSARFSKKYKAELVCLVSFKQTHKKS